MSNIQEESVFTSSVPALPRYVTGWAKRINEALKALANRTKWIKDSLETKLDSADYNQYWKGVHSSEAALNIAHPTAAAGSYATVDAGENEDAIFYWFDVDDGWITNGTPVSISTTDALVEGTTNLYFTSVRAIAAVTSSINAAVAASLNPTINPQTGTSYTVQTVDNDGKTYLRMTNANPNTVHITTSQTKPISVSQRGDGVTTLVEESGVTMNGDLVFTAKNQTKTIIPLGSGIFDVVG